MKIGYVLIFAITHHVLIERKVCTNALSYISKKKFFLIRLTILSRFYYPEIVECRLKIAL